MSVITARGVDSSEAMDEVIRRLGVNAYILSTTVRDGMVEIRAATDLPPPSPPPPPAASFADLLEARSDWAPAAPLRPAVPPRPTPWARIPPEVRHEALLDRLEADILAPDALPVGQLLPRTVIIGPPGAGKSLLAVRMAAAALLADRSVSPRIIAPRAASLLSDDRLRGWARLIGITPERPLIGDLVQADDGAEADAQRPHLIDLSDLADARADLVAALAAAMPTEIILTLPSGLSARRIRGEVARWDGLDLRVALTGCDLCGPDQATLEAIAGAGVRLARATTGTGVLDALCTPVRADLARWLQEEDDAQDADLSESLA